MKSKPIFLLSNSLEITPTGKAIIYDQERSINVLFEDKITPVVLSKFGITHSKTDSARGDDDPDPNLDKCY